MAQRNIFDVDPNAPIVLPDQMPLPKPKATSAPKFSAVASDQKIKINDNEFSPLPGVRYPHGHNYVRLARKVKSGEWDEASAYRQVILEDLFFVVYFVLGVKPANHPFVINMCEEVKQGPQTQIVDLWAREHFKSTIITTAKTVQDILRNPEERIAIFSYAKTPAVKLLRPIKLLFEQSDFLKMCFPDVLYENPEGQSPKWAEESGLIVKRKGYYKEATLEAHGLIEGMPTGSHFTKRIYDDIETEDLVGTPEMMEKVKRAYDVSQFLGSADGTHQVIGTPYHWNGPLQYIIGKVYEDGRKVYSVRKKPGTVGGTATGEPVLMTQEKIDFWRTDKRSFAAQCLLDPTPLSERPLNSDFLKFVSRKKLPERLYKFMLVDPAGSSDKRRDGRMADAWALGVWGVDPYLDELGASNVYLLDLCIRPMNEAEAMTEAVDMYCRNGRILKLGVEKVAMTTAEVHIANALRMKGRFVSIENGGIHILRPGGRSKQQRIESALQWPLNNGKIHVLEEVDNASLERLRTEMERFPYWHDDGLDMASYLYDMLKVYTFGAYRPETPEGNSEKDRWQRAFDRRRARSSGKNSWLEV